MKRPAMAYVIVAAQMLFAIGGVAIALLVAAQTHSPQILKTADAAEAVHGLWIATSVIGVPSLLLAALAIALLFRTRWAWYTGLVLNALLLSLSFFSTVTDRPLDTDMVVVTALLLGMFALYMVPPVRKWYLGPHKAPPIGTTQA